MRTLFTKWLSALLIAALLLTPVALMEEEPSPVEAAEITDVPAEDAPIVDEPTEVIEEPEDTVEEINAPAEEISSELEEDILAEAAEAAVEEVPAAMDLDLVETETLVESLPAATAETGGIEINSVNFPDKALLEYVSRYDDTAKYDDETGEYVGIGVLTDDELVYITGISMTESDGEGNDVPWGFTTLEGIQNLPYVEYVDCSNGSISELDVSGMENLKSIYLDGNNMKRLIAHDCPVLDNITIYNSKVDEVDLSNCHALKDDPSEPGRHAVYFSDSTFGTLDLHGCDGLITPLFDTCQVGSLNVQDCAAIDWLNCEGIQNSLNVRGCASLTHLIVNDGGFASLDVSGLKKLEYLDAVNCANLSELNASGCSALPTAYLFLDFDSSALKKLDLSGCEAITRLEISNNSVEEINVTGCKALESFLANDCALTSLKLSGCKALTTVNCSNNRLPSIDLTGCSELSYLNLDNNALTDLDLADCEKLDYLSVTQNQLTALDVSGKASLESLYFRDNPDLVTLDVQNCTSLNGLAADNNMSSLKTVLANGCTALTEVRVFDNIMETLELSGCKNLLRLDCYDCELSRLIVEGCGSLESISGWNNSLETLDLTGLSNLKQLYLAANPLKELDLTPCPILSELISYDYFHYYPYDKYVAFERTVENESDSENYVLEIKSSVKTIPALPEDTEAIEINETNFKNPIFRKYVEDNFDTQETDHKLSRYEIALARYIRLYTERVDESTGEIFHDPLGVTSLKGIEYFTDLVELDCSDNIVGELDLSGNPKLDELYCDNCGLSSLDVSMLPELRYLDCSNNSLTALDLSNNPWLSYLRCTENQLTTLDVSNQPRLEELSCEYNQLTTLNLSNNAELTELTCEENKLTALDISKCPFIADHVNSNTYELQADGAIVSYLNKTYGYPYLRCDASVKITGGNPVVRSAAPATPTPAPAPAVAPAPAPVAPPVPVIPAIRKSSKTTISAAPYTVAQLELGGVVGKGFKSSNKKVATVNGAGLVTVKKAGKTKITFKVGRKKRTVTLTIKDPTIPTAVYLNLAGTVPAQVGVPQALVVTLPEGTNSGIKWKSSNKKVATVSNGVVTFKKAGKVTITATATRGKKKAKVKFKVTK